jgi:S1-C subfamily serine protease
MAMRLLALLGATATIAASVPVPEAQTRGAGIPAEQRARSVLIKIPGDRGKTGSGFFLRGEAHTYLVTAKHVLLLSPEDDGVDVAKPRGSTAALIAHPIGRDRPEPIRTTLDLQSLFEAGAVVWNADEDIAAVRVGELARADARDAFVASPRGRTAPFDDVRVGTEAYVFGFPTTLGLPESAQFDHHTPLLRRGIVAGKYAEQNTLVLDFEVAKGDSGGPVVVLDDRGFVTIGMISRFIPRLERWKNLRYGYENTRVLNSGYAVAVSVDAAWALVAQFEQSPP